MKCYSMSDYCLVSHVLCLPDGPSMVSVATCFLLRQLCAWCSKTRDADQRDAETSLISPFHLSISFCLIPFHFCCILLIVPKRHTLRQNGGRPVCWLNKHSEMWTKISFSGRERLESIAIVFYCVGAINHWTCLKSERKRGTWKTDKKKWSMKNWNMRRTCTTLQKGKSNMDRHFCGGVQFIVFHVC